MSDVFVSYSRVDGQFVRQLHEALERVGKDAWVDWQDIAPTAEWRAEIYQAIEDADAFVFVLSPESVSSEECASELAHAAGHNKRIVPLHYRTVDPKVVPDPVSSHQWISFDSDGGFDRSFQELVRALDTDFEWVAAHTHWLGRARDWEKQERDKSLLLRGSDLRAAEDWLSRQGENHKPDPTPLHNEYVYASRRAASRRQRSVVGAISGALLVAVTLAIIALIARNQTRQEERVGASRLLTFEAEKREASDPSLSILLSLAASNSADTPEARRSLQSQIVRQRHVQSILTGPGPVGVVAYSPDGRVLAAAGAGGISVWDRRGRAPPARLRQPTGTVRALSFSRNGRLLAAGGDGGAAVWDTTRPDRPRVRRAWRDRAGTLALSPDGRRIVFAGEGPTLIVQDVVGDRRETIRVRGDKRIDGIAITPDSRRAVTAGDGGASVSNLATGARERRFRFDYREQVTKTALALSADGRMLATTAASETRLWDMGSGSKLDTLRSATGDLLAFRPDGDALAATQAGEDGNTEIVTYGVGEKGFLKAGVGGPAALPERLAVGERRNVSGLAYSPDSRTLASGSTDGTVTLWDPESPDTISNDKLRDIDTVAFDSEGELLALGGAPRKGEKDVNDVLSLVDVARRRTLYHTPCASFAAPRPRSSMWAVSGPSCGGVLALIDPSRREGQRLVTELPPLPGRSPRRLLSEGVRFSPDGRLLAEQVRPVQPGRLGDGKVNQTDKELLIWDPKTPRAPIARLKVAPPELLFANTAAESFAFSPDGRTLAIGRSYDRSATDVGDDVKVLLWDTRRRMTTATIKLDSFVYSLAFHPSGGLLAVGLKDRVELWRVADRTRVGLIRDVHGPGQQLAFTPDGEKLAVADRDGVQLWSVKPVAPSGVRLPGNHGLNDASVSEFAFALSPDRRTLAVADGSQAVAMWNLAAETWHWHLCRIVDRDFTPSERARFLPPAQRSGPTCSEG